eukprot:CAMPEP_0205923356 /NCGR_PEP_ID=MMETSP1325-20131115/16086_1 /ASSEMBLY_ACC=CAM_ASM_000708 /TAXON_ID=236786 /ORGANISM="Florenciella sp., Strain RCC1007" /LENGTH=54 /DNA_ID=CAMNT_0053291557 /DNA_START=258 /DNA_END=422 /DNA_ORIENTATION=-
MPGVGHLQPLAASLAVYVLKMGPDPSSAMHTFASPCPSPPLSLPPVLEGEKLPK